ncbi:MAG TPA: hypothetical protein ENN21_08190, partial [Spirochaetes bacterium]|nr:hypothetical protein [Spirochaetota bacterium]
MDSPLPRLYLFDQDFHQDGIADIEGAVLEELSKLACLDAVGEGSSVAVTAGSRGIRHINRVTAAVVRYFKSLGARPFIIPAMGSHGGSTAEGQMAILASYGITEEAMGCEVRSSMEVVT